MTAAAFKGDYFSIDIDSNGTEFVRTGDEVLIVPLTEGGDVILTIEPAPAFGSEPTLILPGGEVESNEPQAETANRELQEEIGYKAERMDFLGELRPFSKYLTVRSYVFLARDLTPSKLAGDEDYEVGIERVPLSDFESLIASGYLHDARVIAALYTKRGHKLRFSFEQTAAIMGILTSIPMSSSLDLQRPPMIQIEFAEEEMKALNHERYHHPHPSVQRKMEVLWLKAHGLAHDEIARLADVSSNTLRSYFREYEEGGLEKLKEVNFYQPHSELVAHQGTLEAHFRKNPPATIKEAAHEIQELTGITRSETQVRAFLTTLGMKCRKVGMVPAKADPDAQAAYKVDQLEPRLAEAQAGKRAVFFTDAAHFVLAPFLGFLWCFTRVFIKAPAGRQRFNVLGALNALTHELITVTNDTYINAESVCELLRKLAALNLSVPITLFLDNARYQKCALVMTLAQSLNIELCFLPAYSPNLNLIERLWKFVKKECLYSEYYADFASFKAAILDCLSQTHTKHKAALDSLLTLNFQTFEKAQIMTL